MSESCRRHAWDTAGCPYCTIDTLEQALSGLRKDYDLNNCRANSLKQKVKELEDKEELWETSIEERLAIRNHAIEQCAKVAEWEHMEGEPKTEYVNGFHAGRNSAAKLIRNLKKG